MAPPPCACRVGEHDPKLVVLTGGPGAGKTAVLEVVRRHFCEHIVVLPEAASIVFGGGFPRRDSPAAERAAQRAIYRVQRELEQIVLEERHAAVALCDRGTVDGLAYWPDSPQRLWAEVGTSLETELARYAAVIHLRTPTAEQGYDHSNPVRIESAGDAARIDRRIAGLWRPHPRRVEIESADAFIDKVVRAVDAIKDELPSCCRSHRIDEAAPC